MGSSKYTYITPYLEVVGKLEVTIMKIKRVCPKHPSNNQGSNKFCGICGSEIENVDVPTTRKVDPADVLNDANFEDNLYSPEYLGDDILLPNQNPLPKLDFDSDGGCALNLYSDEMDAIKIKQVQWFEKQYKDEITLLQEKFGPEKVHVRWGVVSYWS